MTTKVCTTLEHLQAISDALEDRASQLSDKDARLLDELITNMWTVLDRRRSVRP